MLRQHNCFVRSGDVARGPPRAHCTTWEILRATAQLEDPALAVALPVAALVDAVVADEATVRAYRAKRHPEFLAEHEAGRVAALRLLLSIKFGTIDPEVEARLVAASPELLVFED